LWSAIQRWLLARGGSAINTKNYPCTPPSDSPPPIERLQQWVKLLIPDQVPCYCKWEDPDPRYIYSSIAMSNIKNREIASTRGKDLLKQIQVALPRMIQLPVDTRGNQQYELEGPLNATVKQLLEELGLGVRNEGIQWCAATNQNCSLHQGTLQFWTLFGASLLEFAAFVYTYGFLFCTLQTGSPKKRWKLGLLTILHFLVELTAIVCSFLGWQVSSLQCLLQSVSGHSALAATNWMRLPRERSSSNIRSRPKTAPDSSSLSALTQQSQRGSAAKIPLSVDASSRKPSTAPSIPYWTPELDGLNGAKRKEAIDQAFNVQTSLSLGRSSLEPYRAQHELPEVREPIERRASQGRHQSLTNESKTEPESEMVVKHQSSNTLVIDTELHEDDIERARVNVQQTWAILKDDRDMKLGMMKVEGRRVENAPECACTDWVNFRNCPNRRCLYRSRKCDD